MPIVIDNFEELIKYLKKNLTNQEFFLIAIDGKDDAGKTYLGKKISESFKIKHIDIDDNFLNKNQGEYLKAIRYDSLKKKIDNSLTNNIIISGICILKILKKIKFKPNILIYVKRVEIVESYKFWKDKHICTSNESPEDRIIKDLASAYKTGMATTSYFNKKEHIVEIEMIKYHQKFKTYEKADIIFERILNNEK